MFKVKSEKNGIYGMILALYKKLLYSYYTTYQMA